MVESDTDAVATAATTTILSGAQDLITSLALKRAMEIDEDAFFSRKQSSLQFRDLEKKKKKKSKRSAVGDRKQKKKEEVLEDKPQRGRRVRNSSRSRSSSPIVILETAPKKREVRKPTLSPPPALSREQLEAAKNALLSSDVFGSTRSVIDIYDGDSDDGGARMTGSNGDDDDDKGNAGDTNTDLLPELAARIRERMKTMTTLGSATPNYPTEMSTPKENQFIVHVLVETQISLDPVSDAEDPDEQLRIKSRVFKVKSTYNFSKIRYAWMKASKIPEDMMDTVVFLDNGSYSRLYDESTPLMVGVTEEDPHLSILAVRKNEVDKLRQELLERVEHMSDDDDASNKSDEDEDVEIPSSQPLSSNEIKIYLQDGKGERIYLKVKSDSKISTIIKYYRNKRNIEPKMHVTLEMDDEIIPENLTVSETEIEDEVTIDVHVR
ncbi:hypothetical protein V1520DRAFT_363174 [Lipomyces starkeyi]|uniref:Rad60/SUMO-like domain-containing protein n=1 Tax=Lipomyces starkeyi NRRL Y-11557 TaxID=675824 RepID=A0A1E3QGI5_LIPST|nr:hypothetical protein LIPSTDRAFT_144371 [Lipomyces starkeyi NRRL Y-11557]